MRALLAISAIVLSGTLAAPASAQMCGGGQNVAAESQSPGMCGGMAPAAAPASETQAGKARSSGCGCCQNMAMMQPSVDGNNESAPMMDMPRQDAPAPAPQ